MPSASSCFLPVFGFRKVTQKSSPEKIKKITKIIFHRKSPGARRAGPAKARGPRATLGRGSGGPAPGTRPLPSDTASRRRFFYLYLRRETAEKRTLFQKKDPWRRHHQTLVSGVRKLRPGTLPGRGLAPEAISIDAAASMMLRE